jgi:outer membrane protein assembly factor BamD (BamD/ComL family)
MKNKAALPIILLLLFSSGLRQASAEEEYSQAQNAVKSGDKEFAFMHFLSVLKNNPESKHRQEALFATAEYFLLVSDYGDAFNALEEFLEEYPYSEMRTFTLLYLLKIARIWQDAQLAKDIQKQIIDAKRIILLFKNTQEYTLKSPLGINYKLIYYIDRLEFYLDGKLQTQIYY